MAHPLDRLHEAVLAARNLDPSSSRTARLLASGPKKMAQKVIEEAAEVGIEAVAGDRHAMILESADLLYNLSALWAATGVAPGDFVVLNWRAVCGNCRACDRGEPWYCFATHNATQKMTLEDGTELSPALGIGALAENTLVAAGQCTKVDPSARAAAVGLLGCGVMAGLGAAINTGNVGRGSTVAVIGCGGVGAAAIAGAALAGAARIIAVDLDDRKLEWARGFGATDVVNAGAGDVVEALRGLTGGFGPDIVIDAVGRPETYKQAFEARDLAGTVVLVGVPTPAMQLEMPLIEFFGHGGALKSSWYGDCLPSRDFPLLVDLFLQGRFALDAFVSERIGLDDVEEAFHRMERGEVLRSVVALDGGASSLRPASSTW